MSDHGRGDGDRTWGDGQQPGSGQPDGGQQLAPPQWNTGGVHGLPGTGLEPDEKPGWADQPPPGTQPPPGNQQPAGLQGGPVAPGTVNPAYLPQQAWTPPPPPSSLPVEPTRHPMFWRTPSWSPWKPIVAIVVGFVAFFIFQLIAMGVALAIDTSMGTYTLQEYLENAQNGKIEVTPAFFLANNVALGLSIPLSMLFSKWPFGQRPGWLGSVIGKLRWKFMLTYAAIISVPWLVLTVLSFFEVRDELKVTSATWVLAIGILITTPLQAAGEEYLFRGALLRAVASFVRKPVVGFGLGGIVQAVLFMFAHGAGDLTLNVYYFTFGVICAWLVWRTGGLEAAIAVHVVNNVLSESLMPFTDISGMFDRQAGAASFIEVLPVLVCLVIAVIVAELFVRFRKPEPLGPPETLAGQRDAVEAAVA